MGMQPVRRRGRGRPHRRGAAATPRPARCKPIYNHMNDLPALEGRRRRRSCRRNVLRRTIDHYASFDAGRGCPFQCSFCTIINVQGRKSRRRSPDDVERLIRAHYAQGIRRFFITDDNFARNKDWEAIFDRIILMRERDKIDVKLVIQVDTLCHKIPNFIEKAARAGVRTRLHRPREHQSRQPAGGEEAAEQDHRIPQDAAGVEECRRHHLCRLHPRLPERHAGVDRARTSRSSRRNCRSTFWSSSA